MLSYDTPNIVHTQADIFELAMQNEPHIYERTIQKKERTSLSVIAEMVSLNAKVLDLGCGTGALGKYLFENKKCLVDGITFNDKEAEIASTHYRKIHIGDLENPETVALFAHNTYDFIVCADVLEHLKHPEQVLDACRHMLAPGGQLIISIPNASYSGLLLELMHGDWRYRPEGLLDATHLRFFTRRSLVRFLNQQHWHVDAMDTIQRPLDDSEFRDIATDALPPALVRHLFTQADALTYQLICTAHPVAQDSHQSPEAPAPATAHPTFTTTVYWADEHQYAEAQKTVVRGNIGQLQQTIRFAIPAFAANVPTLRWDPADRPGFVHLHRITLSDSLGNICWQSPLPPDWSAFVRNDVHVQPAFATAPHSSLCLLSSDDAWVQLPIPSGLLRQCLQTGTAMLDIEMGWPMSADYAGLSGAVQQLQTALSQAHNNVQQQHTQLQASAHTLQLQQARSRQLQDICDHYAHDIDVLRHEIHLMRVHIEGQNVYLDNLHHSTAYRISQKMVALKQKLWRSKAAAAAIAPAQAEAVDTAAPSAPRVATTIDIIVPVYRGLADTQRCLHSVLHTAAQLQTPFQLVVINDASPEPQLTAWLRELAQQHPEILLLENAENLGFVATVNRGMALHPTHDVLLLNSDTEVANDWLDRLHAAAYRASNTSSVTPLSSNATICSYPRFCESNDLPAGMSTSDMDQLCNQVNAGQAVSIPTAVGFCMYIRRDSLQQLGLFDEEHFGKGYGEENDFCMRALEAGWQHLLALDTFVLHTGGVSFGPSKGPREQAAGLVLLQLHPQYDRLVQQHVASNPALPARQRLDKARLQHSAKRRILMVCHSHGGGTMRHVRELAQTLHESTITLLLSPLPDGSMQLQWLDPHEGYTERFDCETDFEQLLHTLRELGVVHVHYQHLQGLPEKIMQLAPRLNVSYDFTVHDYYTVCPQVFLSNNAESYCTEAGPAQCAQCIRQLPVVPGLSQISDWHQRHALFLEGARYLLAPSRDTAERVRRYMPQLQPLYVPHLDMDPARPLPAPRAHTITPHANLRVFVLGALSAVKGSNVLEAVSTLAATQQAQLEFHLLGYPHRPLQTQPEASLSIHGRYEEAQLVRMLERLQPDVVWFPAQIPETYSYTLSACLQAGVPIIAPALGAFPERLSARAWTWLRPWQASPAQWLEFFEHLRTAHFVTGNAPAPAPHAPIVERMQPAAWRYDREYLQGLPLPAAVQPD